MSLRKGRNEANVSDDRFNRTHEGFPVNGTGTFTHFVVVGGRGYGCKAMRYEGSEIVLICPCVVTSSGWYWPDPELRFPKEAVQQILPGEWTYGADVFELSRRVNLVTQGHW